MEKSITRKNASSGKELPHGSGSERGVALVLVLVLSMIGLIVMTTVLYVITMGTQLSGSEKRYRTAREAALGSVDVIRKIIADQAANPFPGIPVVYQPTFGPKFGGPNMSAPRNIDPTDPNTYDLTVDLGNPAYRVYAKIVQLQKGNTQKGYRDRVRTAGGVVPPEDMGGPMFVPTYYTITLLAQKTTNANERFRMDVVHIF